MATETWHQYTVKRYVTTEYQYTVDIRADDDSATSKRAAKRKARRMAMDAFNRGAGSVAVITSVLRVSNKVTYDGSRTMTED